MSLLNSACSSSENRIDFMPLQKSFLPFEWRNIGQAFTINDDAKQLSSASLKLSGRASFVVRQGYDSLDKASIPGRVLEGDGDFGVSVRAKTLAFSIAACNLAMRTGLDDPLAPGVAAAGTAPSLKATVTKEYAPDSFIAASYDLKMRKPEFSVCWTGDTFTEKATLCLNVDPVHRTMKVGAAVSFPGSEWRDMVYDEDRDVIEAPKDDGARHWLWLRHEARHRDLLYRTKVGATLDLGRMVNLVTDFIDYQLEPRFPPIFWQLPLSQTLYNLLVPAEDENQIRHHIKGWDLDMSYEFGRTAPKVALSKSLHFATISASWDAHDKEAGLEYALKGVKLGAKLGRIQGLGWKQPSLYLKVEPLSLL